MRNAAMHGTINNNSTTDRVVLLQCRQRAYDIWREGVLQRAERDSNERNTALFLIPLMNAVAQDHKRLQ